METGKPYLTEDIKDKRYILDIPSVGRIDQLKAAAKAVRKIAPRDYKVEIIWNEEVLDE